jgi:ADP-ribose pyrophosphatase YjhB (NUDIX family)
MAIRNARVHAREEEEQHIQKDVVLVGFGQWAQKAYKHLVLLKNFFNFRIHVVEQDNPVRREALKDILATVLENGDLFYWDSEAAPAREVLAHELEPNAIAFVGKEAYRGPFGERPELGPQLRTLGSTGLYVLPSTSPANAAVPYDERLHWFAALHEWLRPPPREAVRAVVLDADERILLVRYENPVSHHTWWGTPGGGVEAGESHEVALRRELREELGLHEFELGPLVWEHERTFPWDRRLIDQRNTVYLVRVHAHEPVPTIDLGDEGVSALRWWTFEELAETSERLTPPDFLERVTRIVRD